VRIDPHAELTIAETAAQPASGQRQQIFVTDQTSPSMAERLRCDGLLGPAIGRVVSAGFTLAAGNS
jgi:hypothetical protein